MSAPTLQILVGFEQTANFGTPFQLNSATLGLLNTGTLGGTQLVDVTSMGESVTITRGRNRETEQFNAGTATVVFDDPTRIFDPLNDASPYYPFVGPRNPIIISANGIPIYSGLVTDWDLDYGFTTAANKTSVQCSDGFTVFANQSFDEWTPTAQSSGARVNAVLARPEVNYQGARAISTGSSTLGAYLIPLGGNVLQYLQNVGASEQGYLFMSSAGTLTFRSRADALNPVPVLNFNDDGTGIRYQSLTNAYGDELLFNYVQTQSPAGAVQIASDAFSIARYQSQNYSKLDLLNSTTAEVAGLGDYLLGRYKNPQVRFTGIGTQLAALSQTDQDACLGIELTDIVAVGKTFDTGNPSHLTQTLITSGVSHDIRPGSHVIRFTFESTDGNAYLTLNADPLGKLDTNLLAF
jgi:hypothetical protein